MKLRVLSAELDAHYRRQRLGNAKMATELRAEATVADAKIREFEARSVPAEDVVFVGLQTGAPANPEEDRERYDPEQT